MMNNVNHIDRIRLAINKVRTKPIPWSHLRQYADHGRIPNDDKYSSHIEYLDLPGGLFFSCCYEEHPIGWLLHICMHVQGVIPSPDMVKIMMNKIGLTGTPVDVWEDTFTINPDKQGEMINLNFMGTPREAAGWSRA